MYYKVLRRGLVSNMVFGDAAVTYELNKWVTAPDWLAEQGYHLCVFDSFKNAAYFADGDEDLIFECEVRGVLPELPPKLPILSIAGISSGKIYNSALSNWPIGTVMAKKVKLTKKIDHWEERYANENFDDYIPF